MICRFCKGNKLIHAVDLGHGPISNELLINTNKPADQYELKMLVCKDCGLGQVSKDLPRERLFENYTFATSVSKGFVQHSHAHAKNMIEKLNLDQGGWVLELASNDGYMLEYFKDQGIDVLGVDPAKNISLYAIAKGIPTITEFFGEGLAREILKLKGFPRLIIANNVLAHVPDIEDFMRGIALLCGEATVVTIENPSILNILLDYQFDTIYHEHYSYLSCYFINDLAKHCRITLFDVEKIPTMGMSNRYWLAKNMPQTTRLKQEIQHEVVSGLLDEFAWSKTQDIINKMVSDFYQKVFDLSAMGKRIFGYTASSKATVLLNFAKINNSMIKSIADDGVNKQNKFVPGVNIPIVSFDQMMNENPDEVIVFSWNIFNAINQKIKEKNNNINVWTWLDASKYSL